MSSTISSRLLRTSSRRPNRRSERHLRLERLEDRVVLSGGVVTTPLLGHAMDHFLETDGDIVAVGYSSAENSYSTFTALRYKNTGTLDTTFGDDGVVTTSIGRAGDHAIAAAAYPDDRIVLAGYAGSRLSLAYTDFAVARYNHDGSLDSTFGGKAKNAGTVQTDVSWSDVFRDVMVQPDEKIVGVGRNTVTDNYEFAVVRYTAAGKLDTTFGDRGIVTTDIGDGGSHAQGVTMHKGGILVAGFALNDRTESDFAIARYDLFGELDQTFGVDGIVVMDFNTLPDDVGMGDDFAAVVTDGDRIYVAGYSVFQESETAVSIEVTIVRLDDKGHLDGTFGNGGRISLRAEDGQVPGTPIVTDIVLHEGKLVLAGYAWENHVDHFFVARIDPEFVDPLAPDLKGGLDPEFGGGDGWVRTEIFESSRAQSVAIDPTSGKIVVSGNAKTGSDNFLAVARYHSETDEEAGIVAGDLDETFGNVGNAPVANDDQATTDKVTPILIDVLANDSDPDGDSLSVTAVTVPGNGTAAINDDHTITYTPDTGFAGEDSFTYTISDGNGGIAQATVTIDVVTTGDPMAIYVYDVRFESKRGNKDWRAVFEIRSDSNGDGQGSAADDVAPGVAITVEFAGRSYTGTTDSDGVFRASWIKSLGSGSHFAEVVDLALANYFWDPLDMDLEDDSDGDGNPDDVLIR